MIVSFPGIVTAIITALTYHNNVKNHAATMGIMGEVKKATDGMMSAKVAEVAKLTGDKEVQAHELTDVGKDLAHAQGRREGIEMKEAQQSSDKHE